jgi:hypothetical protein
VEEAEKINPIATPIANGRPNRGLAKTIVVPTSWSPPAPIIGPLNFQSRLGLVPDRSDESSVNTRLMWCWVGKEDQDMTRHRLTEIVQ